MAKGNIISKKGDNKGGQSSFLRDLAVKHTYNGIVEGKTYSNLIDALLNDDYGIGKTYKTSWAADIVATARKMVKSDWEEDRKTLKESLYITYMDLFAEARNAKDRTSAINILKELAKLGGAYEGDKVNLNINGEIDINFNLDNEG